MLLKIPLACVAETCTQSILTDRDIMSCMLRNADEKQGTPGLVVE